MLTSLVLTPFVCHAVQPSIHAKPFIPTSASTGQLSSAQSTPASMSSAARAFVPGSAASLLSPAASGRSNLLCVSWFLDGGAGEVFKHVV